MQAVGQGTVGERGEGAREGRLASLAYLATSGIDTGNGNRASATDMTLGTRRVEVTTASLGNNRAFQFKHRLDKQYDFLLCLGICPQRIVFNVWRKGAIAEGEAGHLVRMAEGQSITHKLTKRID